VRALGKCAVRCVCRRRVAVRARRRGGGLRRRACRGAVPAQYLRRRNQCISYVSARYTRVLTHKARNGGSENSNSVTVIKPIDSANLPARRRLSLSLIPQMQHRAGPSRPLHCSLYCYLSPPCCVLESPGLDSNTFAHGRPGSDQKALQLKEESSRRLFALANLGY